MFMASRLLRLAQRNRYRTHLVLTLAALTPFAATALHAQSVDDGIMLSRQKYCTGIFATYDTFDHYWQGTLNRTNANIGAVTTRTYSYIGNYGLTNRINLLVNVPYVRTSTSQGVLHGQAGFQDVTFSVKVKAVSLPIGKIGALRGMFVLSGSQPMSRYTPDDEPVSIGTQSQTLSGRTTANYLGHNGVYLNGSAAYTFRGNVTLARSSYYTNGHLYLSNQVAMPNQLNYNVNAGYRRNDTTLVATFQQQQTRGGGDIQPQDSPFVSDRFNASRVGGTLTVPLPRVHALQFWAIYSYTFTRKEATRIDVWPPQTLKNDLRKTTSRKRLLQNAFC